MSDPVLISLIGMVLAPIIVGFLARRGVIAAKEDLHDDLAHRVGSPNGHGNLTQMMERLLDGQTGQDARLARLEGRQLDLRQGHAAHGVRLGALEQDVAALRARQDTAPCRDTEVG